MKGSMVQQQQTVSRGYNPNHLLDTLIQRMGLTNDGALARALKVARPIIHDIRHGRLPVAASLLMWIHEATGISINELRMLMGDRRTKFRLGHAISK
jgi:plasmid maintenance system antidote protein VapI